VKWPGVLTTDVVGYIIVLLCAETVWLREWVTVRGVERATSVYSSHCLRRHSRTGNQSPLFSSLDTLWHWSLSQLIF